MKDLFLAQALSRRQQSWVCGRTELAAAVRVDKGRRSRRKVAVGLGCRMPAVGSKHVSSPVKLEEEVTSYSQ